MNPSKEKLKFALGFGTHILNELSKPEYKNIKNTDFKKLELIGELKKYTDLVTSIEGINTCNTCENHKKVNYD